LEPIDLRDLDQLARLISADTPPLLTLSLSCAPALTVPEAAGGLPAALAEPPDRVLGEASDTG